MMTAERLTEILQERFPAMAHNGVASLDFVSAEEQNASLEATLRLVTWDVDPRAGTSSIRNIMQQPVLFVPAPARDEEARVIAFAGALVDVLGDALAHPGISDLLPHDLVPADALLLARAETERDFVAALRAKSRLGKYLP
jgi:hypothetical protein